MLGLRTWDPMCIGMYMVHEQASLFFLNVWRNTETNNIKFHKCLKLGRSYCSASYIFRKFVMRCCLLISVFATKILVGCLQKSRNQFSLRNININLGSSSKPTMLPLQRSPMLLVIFALLWKRRKNRQLEKGNIQCEVLRVIPYPQVPISSLRATSFKVNEFNQQFVMFMWAYHGEHAFKGAIEQGNISNTDFKEAWSLTNKHSLC